MCIIMLVDGLHPTIVEWGTLAVGPKFFRDVLTQLDIDTLIVAT